MAIKVKNEAEYQALLAQLAQKDSGTIKQSQIENEKLPPKKRQGVKETPILSSLDKCKISVECSPTHATIVFDGARLFTLNEIYALLQYRSYIIFSYKKKWQALVHKALKAMGEKKPHFDTPCKITIFRQGKKAIDRDSLFVMYKYIIDALKDEPEVRQGLFPDDNPDIVYSDEKIQSIGQPIVGIRIDLISPIPTPTKLSVSTLFDTPPDEISALAHQEPETPTIVAKTTRRKKAPKVSV